MQHDFVSISVGTVYNGNFISSVIMQVSAGLRDAHLSVLHLDHMYMCLHIQRLEEVRNRTTPWGTFSGFCVSRVCVSRANFPVSTLGPWVKITRGESRVLRQYVYQHVTTCGSDPGVLPRCMTKRIIRSNSGSGATAPLHAIA